MRSGGSIPSRKSSGKHTAASDFYQSKEWARIRAKVRAIWKAKGFVCAYCFRPIQWGQEKTVVDHKINRKQRPDLALEISNLQVVHHACNTKKYHSEEKDPNRPQIGPDGFPIGGEW